MEVHNVRPTDDDTHSVMGYSVFERRHFGQVQPIIEKQCKSNATELLELERARVAE